MTAKKDSCPPPPIAILGMGLRLPGGISTPEHFWNLLINKMDGRCRVPADRYNVGAFYDNKLHGQAVASDHGYFLQNVNLKGFDASFFSMSRSEVEVLDPQQRLLLEVVWECMERAGQTNWRGTNTGCYVGAFGEDWHDLQNKDTQAQGSIRITGAGDFALSNRISYEYNLKGPSMTIRTACSSTLICLHEACQALYNGECSAAIVAGTSLIMSPSMTQAMTEQGVLSPTGSCKTFDAAADGFARGEAVNAILIKRLDDAIRDNNPIRAVIRSTAVNCDGKTPGMACPSAESHEIMIRRAYDVAGISDVSETAYVECHGTGTQTGDPLEATAVANVFGERGVYIGSAKPNVGHSEGASGITSLIKAVLALENQVIPPNINFTKPNPKIPFQRWKLVVPLEITPWPKGRQARVSVNSFGIGGANAHVIVDSAASFGVASPKAIKVIPDGGSNRHSNGTTHTDPNRQLNEHSNSHPDGNSNNRPEANSKSATRMLLRLIPISANNAESLQRRAQDLRRYIEYRPGSLDDIAHTMGTCRDHLSYRAFCLANDDESLEFKGFHKIRTTAPGVTFVFTGQGAQWAGMGKDMMQSLPSFREDIQEMDRTLQGLVEPPEWTIEGILYSENAEDLIGKAEYSQPLCTALQIALVNFITRCGVIPIAVVGHSSGEIAAAYAAGAITATEAILGGYCRGLATKRQTRKGGMAAVGMGRDAVSPYLVDGALVACDNSPKSVTLSGDEDALRQTLEAIKAKKPGTFTRYLHVDMAYHSHHMCEVGDVYEEMLKQHLFGKEPAVPFYSSVTGQRAETRFNPAYWRSNFESPVLFNTAVQTLLNDLKTEAVFLEIGPHSALQGPLREISQHHSGKSAIYVPTLIRDNSSTASALTALGQLYMQGCAVDFSFINPSAATLTDLPNYPWDHSLEYWKESRISLAWRQKKYPHHELLGSRCLECSDIEPAWRNMLCVYEVSWLRDHKIVNDVVFPCAGYIATIGEAIRQISGSEVYTLRNLVVKAAMVLQESDTIEIITTMRPSRLTDSANSSWYDFSISSFNGTSWVQHCVAQGKAGEEQAPRVRTPAPYPRRLSEGFWYERLRHLGLNYGPRFQGLREISAHTKDPLATARVRNDESEHGSKYSIHPTTLDHCLQLFSVAMTSGVARRLDTLAIPSTIQYIYVKPSGPDLIAEAASRVSNKGVVSGDVRAITEDNELVISLENGILVPFVTGDQPLDSNLGAARLEWRPDIDFLEASDLMQPAINKRETRILLDKLCALCLLRTLDTLASLEIPPNYLAKYASWLQEEKDSMIRGEWALLVPEAQNWALLGAETRNSLLAPIDNELRAVGGREAWNIGQILHKVSERNNVRDIFLELLNPLQLLIGDGGLTDVYNFHRGMVTVDEFFSLCAHAQPSLKVLEIGAGTGGATEDILKSLISKEGTRMYSEYTFTDISSGFFTAAKERFQEYSGLNYKVLDISKNPAEQDFHLGTYDLIVASNASPLREIWYLLRTNSSPQVLHATPSLHKTLRNVRSLLRTGGRLFLQELVLPMRWRCGNFIMGTLPGWWLGEDDNRLNEPFVSVERWGQELRDAGFTGIDAAVLDDEHPYHQNANIVASAVELVTHTKDVTFLYNKEKNEFSCELACLFEKEGFRVHWSKIADQEHVAGQDVVSTIDLDGPFFHDISAEDYAAFMTYLSKLDAGVLWLTRLAQIHCSDPRYGLVIGLARTVRSELSLDFSTMELHSLDSATAVAALAVFRKFQRRSSSGDYNAEMEFAVHNGVIHIPRYHWISVPNELKPALKDSEPKRVAIGQHGLIDSLVWVQDESTAIRPDEVEVDICCVGLNFRDVLLTMGIVNSAEDGIGMEASGVITRVGSEVEHVRVGDRIIAFTRCCLATRMVIRGQNVVCIPDNLSFEDAATMPVVYATVIRSIINVGQLAKGQSILIHSACGGVGLAALQICKMLGAEIYVTVGTEEKVRFLMDKIGIPREKIFNSRNVSFLDGVLKATHGRGVDMVLNSLSGELLHASWQCVAKNGKMMEIGKRDFIGRGQLMLDPFEANRSFHGIDLFSLWQDRPEEIRRLMEQTIYYYQQGHIKPIRPIQVFQAQQVTEALRYMQKGEHIGKILITIPEDNKHISAVQVPRQVKLSDKVTYLLAGGLGGLGKALATWMVERGARSFVFLSRSAGKSSEDQAFFRELESQGCRAAAVAGSVAQLADVERAVKAAPTSIAGVIQMSMVLKDLPLMQIGLDDWNTVQNPKVRGTWNLHEALSGVDLSFFILFGSVSAVLGQAGQANYASANTFLGSFVQYRYSLNLPCSVIDVGMMEGVGYISRDVVTLNKCRSMDLLMLQERDLLDAIQISIGRSLPSMVSAGPRSGYTNLGHLAIGLGSSKPLSDASNRASFKRDVRMGLYRQLESNNELSTVSNDGGLRELMNAVTTNPDVLHDLATLELVTREIGRALCALMMQPEENLDVTITLTSMGVDSLVSIEIRNWWRRTLGVDTSVLQIQNAGTIERLGQLAIASLQEKHRVKEKSKFGVETNPRHMQINSNNTPIGPDEVVYQDALKPDLTAEISSFMGTGLDLRGLLAHPVTTLRDDATIFLTGATGYLGTEILHQLLRSPRVNKVAVLVRAKSVQHGIDRIAATAQIAGWWRSSDECKVEVWLGDLAQEGLGLDLEQLMRLQGESANDLNIDAIIHNGAIVNYSADYEKLRASNVDATFQLLRMAVASPAFPKYVYISGGIKRAQQSDTAFATEISSQNCYIQTKYVSERIVGEIASKLPAGQNRISVVKPGIIIGTAATGVANIGDILWRAVATAVALQAYPIDQERAWLYITEVDVVAARVTQQLFATEGVCAFVDILDGLLIEKFWALVNQELEQPCPSIQWNDWLLRATTQINEVGQKHPMWALQDYLDYRRWLREPPQGYDDFHSLHLAVRSNVRYLQRLGYLTSSGHEIGGVKGEAIGRSHMV